jgi:hypothetical protein
LLRAAAEPEWRGGPVVLRPGPKGAFDETAVKDPSIVRHDGLWRLFYTARGQGRYSIGYVAADTLGKLQSAKRHELTTLRGREPYAAAPQVFWFRRRKRWYLVYQTTDSNYQPVFSTAASLDDPTAWSAPQSLAVKEDKGKWIDFWIITDEARVWLFFTREQRDVQAMSTWIDDFPRGWTQPRTVFGPVHESVHVYRVQSAEPEYLMLFETVQPDELRRFGLARAESLGGPWTLVTDAYATGRQLRWPPNSPGWTDEVSHGELIRAGFDDRMEIAPGPVRFLIQGMPAGNHKGDYASLPWWLGLIESTR